MPDVDAVHQDLINAGAIAPVEPGGPDERRWLDCDLASLAENRLGDRTDPLALDDARRADWQARATSERPWPLSERSGYERCYWLLQDGEPAGTIALACTALNRTTVHVASLYVLPSHRGRGVGRRALAQVKAAVARHSLGIRLDASWCWQPAVRFYLANGMWVYMWKRELTLFWDRSTPAPDIRVGDAEASLSVAVDGADVVLARARRHGDALELDDPSPERSKDRRLGEAYWHADSTLALALALHGWPLIRSREAWAKSYYADAGPPEALAYKITIWEALAASRGWKVETPRIPGLEYPTWAQFEARWAAEREAFEASLLR